MSPSVSPSGVLPPVFIILSDNNFLMNMTVCHHVHVSTPASSKAGTWSRGILNVCV
jgi:hypothetical protein